MNRKQNTDHLLSTEHTFWTITENFTQSVYVPVPASFVSTNRRGRGLLPQLWRHFILVFYCFCFVFVFSQKKEMFHDVTFRRFTCASKNTTQQHVFVFSAVAGCEGDPATLFLLPRSSPVSERQVTADMRRLALIWYHTYETCNFGLDITQWFLIQKKNHKRHKTGCLICQPY